MKTIKFCNLTQYLKSFRILFLIDTDLESFIKKIVVCEDNLEK